jgi:hypothetical protein
MGGVCPSAGFNYAIPECWRECAGTGQASGGIPNTHHGKLAAIAASVVRAPKVALGCRKPGHRRWQHHDGRLAPCRLQCTVKRVGIVVALGVIAWLSCPRLVTL